MFGITLFKACIRPDLLKMEPQDSEDSSSISGSGSSDCPDIDIPMKGN